MPKRPKHSDSELNHRLEVAMAFSYVALEALELPRKRLLAVRSDEPSGPWWPDAQYFTIALMRLRKAIEIMAKDHRVKRSIKIELKKFEVAIPSLKTLRDVAEHLDEQVTRSAKAEKRGVSADVIQVASFDGHVLTWLGNHSMNIDTAFDAAMELHLQAQRACIELLGCKSRVIQSEVVTGVAPNLTRTLSIGPVRSVRTGPH